MNEQCKHSNKGKSTAFGNKKTGVCLRCMLTLSLHNPSNPWGKWFAGPVHTWVAWVFPSWEGYYLA